MVPPDSVATGLSALAGLIADHGSALLIECRDPETAAEIAGRPETSSLYLRAGPKTLVVRTNQPTRFRERVRSLGFGMVS